MSAYIVDKEHIRYLVEAAISNAILPHHSHSIRWYWNDNENGEPQSQGELAKGDYDRAAEVANMLWRENIKSVSARYPNESSATLPGPRGGEFVIEPADFNGLLWDSFTPVQVLASCDCYEYQSCEHGGWKLSEAKAFVDRLRNHAWHKLPGYDDATWGAPKTVAERRAELRH